MKTTVRTFTIITFFFAFLKIGNAQVSSYTFSNTTATYTIGTGMTNLATGTGVGGTMDNNIFTAIPIGFSFWFNGTLYTTVGVSTNGFIWFGSNNPATTLYTPISSATVMDGVVAGFACNLYGGASGGAARLSYSSAAGVFMVEWNGVKTSGGSGSDMNRWNMQIRLFQCNNKIEIRVHDYVYGWLGSSSGQVGLRGSTNADYNNVLVDCSTYDWLSALNPTGNNAATCTQNSCYPGGYSNWGCEVFTFSPPAYAVGPTVQFNTPSTSFCAGTCITFTDQSLNSPTSWSWTFPGGTPATSTSQNPTICYNTAGTYNATLAATNIYGTCSLTKTNYIVVTTGITVNVAPASATICLGDSVTLTASGGTTYTWAPAGGLNTTTGSTVIAKPLVTTPYTVTGTTGGCSGTHVVNITVGQPIVANAGNDTSICQGSSATLHGSGGTTYSWSPNINLSCTGCQFPVATPGASTTYTVTVGNGVCPSKIDTVRITVNPVPLADAGSNTTICTGDSTTLHATGGGTYLWSPPANLTCTNCQNPIAFPASGANYTVTVTTGGCTASDWVHIAVGPVITATAGADTTICAGSSALLHGGGGSGYSWSPANGLSCSGCQFPIATPSSTTIYTVTVTNGVCTPATDAVKVTVNPIPHADAGSNVTICSGDTANLHATGGIIYQWSPATGLSCTNCQSPHATPLTSITYTVLVDSLGCVKSDTVRVTVNPGIIAGAGPDTTLCAGAPYVLHGSGGTSYSWSPNVNLSCNNCQFPVATPSSTTTYTVTVSSGTCTPATDAVTVHVTQYPSLSVVPNPLSLCAGSSSPLTASGATTYTWSPGTGLDTTSGPVVIANPATSLTYTLSGNTSGCISTLTIPVSVNSVTVNPHFDTICTGDTVTLTATGSTTYSWSPAGGLSSSSGSTVLAFPSNNITYYATAVCGTGNNLIVNGDFESGNTGFTTAYTLCSSPTCNAGYYVVSTNPGAIHAGWLCGDHTSGSGNMMTLDGSSVANTNVWCQTVNVVPNTNYNFSCWGTAMDNNWSTNAAVLHFFFNGADIGGHLLTDIFSCVIVPPSSTQCGNWIHYTATWNSGGNSTVNICIVDSLTSFAGNDFAIDDISLSGTGTMTDSVKITVLPVVTANAGVDDTICQGSSTTLNATGGSVYSWNPTNNLSCNNCPNPQADPSATSIYTVTVSNGFCSATDAVKVTVDLPVTAQAWPDTAICAGASVQLNASGGGTYSWFPTNDLSCTTCPNPIATPSSTISYTVTVINGICPGATDAVTITVSQLSPPEAGPDDTICTGGTAFLNASGTGTFAWTPTNYLSCTNCPNPQATPPQTMTYTVTLIQGACTSFDTVVVHVLPAINPDAGINAAICQGDSTQLHASGAGTYIWSPAMGLSCTNCPSPWAKPASTTIYTLTVSNGTCSAADHVTVTVSNIPNASITGDTTICLGQSTTLTAAGGTTYLWSTSETAASITVNPLLPTLYSVTVSNLGCTDIASVTVHVAVPDTVHAGADVTILLGESIQLNATGGTSWIWAPDTNLSCFTCPNPVASPDHTTTYTVSAIDANNCSSSDDITITVDQHCGAVYIPSVFSPNGDQNNDVLYIRGNCIATVDFIIYDRWGNKVFSSTDPHGGWDGTLRGKPMDAGVFVYNLKVKLIDGTEVKKKGNITIIR